MSKKIITLFFAAYYIVLGLSPLLGFHGHDDDFQVVHMHEHASVENHKPFTNHVADFDAHHLDHSQEIPVSVFEYLLKDKIARNIFNNKISKEKYVFLFSLFHRENLTTSFVFYRVHHFNTQKLQQSMHICSSFARAPPLVT